MRQFWEAKQAHPGSIMLFRMGDFYETFEDDAKTVSRVLGIALTKRGKAKDGTDIPLAGFPYHALDAHLYKLLKAGHKVAICEQVEDPKLAKGLVKREVVEVVTPGTAMAEKYLERGENNYLAAVVREDDRLGMALLDNSTGEFLVEEIAVGDLMERISRFKPSEVLLTDSDRPHLEHLFERTNIYITAFADWIAEEDTARHQLTDHFQTNSLKGFGVENYPLAIRAAGAALHYVYQNKPGPKGHIAAMRLVQDERYMGLDDFTVRNLELFHSLSTQGTHGTLISVIDRARSAGGIRLLKRWLRAPLQRRDEINERLDRVEAFYTDNSLRGDVQQQLVAGHDLERILGRISTGRGSPRDIANLATSLEIVDEIKALIGGTENRSLHKLCESIAPTAGLAKAIRAAVIEDPPLTTGKGDFICQGYNSRLDELRAMAGSGKSWIADLQERERVRTGIGSLKIGYNNVFGYYIEITRTHQDKVPDNYIRKQTLVNAERYITPDLKEYEEKVLTAEEQSLTLEKELLEEVQRQIMKRARDIQINAHLIAQLDGAAGLAEVATRNHYVRPELRDEPMIELTGARHPVVETLLPVGEQFTPNDLTMNSATNQIHLITGPNMSGKSTFLRQVGLVVVLAQMGSYVPAESASIGIMDRVFTRVGASDNLAGGESTFLVEMVETANILNNATRNSLVLLDEIGRGTSTYDGLSIAWAVTEYIHNHETMGAMTIFATHYHELVALADTLPKVRNYNVAVKEHGKNVVFLRKIVPGGADKSYGIHVARMAGLPRAVIARAGQILHSLTMEKVNTGDMEIPPEPPSQVDLFGDAEEALRDDFREINVNNLTPVEALNMLDDLKKKHGL